MLLVVFINDYLLLKSFVQFEEYYLLTTLAVYLSLCDLGYIDYVKSKNANKDYSDTFITLMIYASPPIVLLALMLPAIIDVNLWELFLLAFGNTFLAYVNNKLFLQKKNHLAAALILIVNLVFVVLIYVKIDIVYAYSGAYFSVGIVALGILVMRGHANKEFKIVPVNFKMLLPYLTNRVLYIATNYGISVYVLSSDMGSNVDWALYHRIFLIITVVTNVFLTHYVRDAFLKSAVRVKVPTGLLVVLFVSFSFLLFGAWMRYNVPFNLKLAIFFLIWLLLDAIILTQVSFIDLIGHSARSQRFNLVFLIIFVFTIGIGRIYTLDGVLFGFISYLIIKAVVYEYQYFKPSLFRAD